jgi:hypothetical protein
MNIEHLRGVLPSHDPGCRVVVNVLGQDWEVSQVTYPVIGSLGTRHASWEAVAHRSP